MKKKRNEKYEVKNGMSIKLINSKIRNELNGRKVKEEKRNLDDSYSAGKLETKDLRNIAIGLDMLYRASRDKFSDQKVKLQSGKDDVSKLKKDVAEYRYIIEETMLRLAVEAREEYEIQKRISNLLKYTKITQAARDGVLLRQETRNEKVNNENKKIIYDTSMGPREVVDLFEGYQRELEKSEANKASFVLSLGLGALGIIGAISANNKDDNMKNGNAGLITLGTTTIAGIKFIRELVNKDDRKEEKEYRDIGRRMERDLLWNEPISIKDEENQIKNVDIMYQKEREANRKRHNKTYAFNQAMNIAVAIITGTYINKRVTIKENGKVDGKSLAKALVEIEMSKGAAGYLVGAIQDIINYNKDNDELRELTNKVNNIIAQMEEKVYPLEGATHKFDSVTIKDFEGGFYPKKDYETGKTCYSTVIKIPEFSMKRGDVVLLSGDSGSGKSTFLRYLKRGDINNRYGIEIDNGEKVDNLGNEYISFRPSLELGSGTNLLQQITGKNSISELSNQEKERLMETLRELKFNTPNLLDELASKNFGEFSTGQQRRLALSKVFYRIDDGTSVIIVDEPVGNVEDSLIREQLEMIKRYAKERNVMLILTTHRLDLAEDLATKRYHINNDGVMEEIKIKDKENNMKKIDNEGEGRE